VRTSHERRKKEKFKGVFDLSPREIEREKNPREREKEREGNPYGPTGKRMKKFTLKGMGRRGKGASAILDKGGFYLDYFRTGRVRRKRRAGIFAPWRERKRGGE